MLLDRIPLYQNNFGLGLKLMIFFFWKVIKTVPNPTFGVKPSQTKQYLLYGALSHIFTQITFGLLAFCLMGFDLMTAPHENCIGKKVYLEIR